MTSESAQSKPQTIANWSNWASGQFREKSNVAQPQLEADLILTSLLELSRSELELASQRSLTDRELEAANHWLKSRLENYPLAYLRGWIEFFGLKFQVSPDVLIPRPESEAMVEIAINLATEHNFFHLLDLGCGSGALGIATAKNLEQFELTLADISPRALKIAQNNAKDHRIAANFLQTNLLQNLQSQQFDLILANLPYVDPDWKFIKGVDFEPKEALFANDQGLELIKKLIYQLANSNILKSKGWLLLESDPAQQLTIRQQLEQSRFKQVSHPTDFLTIAQF